jgi:hypothetical protein
VRRLGAGIAVYGLCAPLQHCREFHVFVPNDTIELATLNPDVSRADFARASADDDEEGSGGGTAAAA